MSNYYNRQWRLPNAWNGTESNVNKQSNYSLSFDGSSQKIDLGNTDAVKLGAGNFTFSAWINPDSWGSSFEAIYANVGTNGVFIGKDNSGNFVLRIFNVSNIITYSTLPTVGAWTHICVTRDNGQCSLFYNGSSVATATSTHNFNASANVFIGSDNGSGDFNGKIDAVSIYNYPLSSSQITTLYGSSSTGIGNPMSLSPKPVAMYNLGDKSAFNGANYLVPNIAAEEADGDIVTSYSPYALNFDGTNYIGLSSGISTNSSSLSIWFKTTTTYAYKGLFGLNSPFSFDYYISLLETGSNKIKFYDGSTMISLTPVINDGNWHNLVLTYNHSSSSFKAYTDGSETYSGSYSQPSGMVLQYIGSTYAVNRKWVGDLSNASLWNAALTSAQVTEIYNEGVPSNLNNHSAYSNLVGWWQLGSNSSFNTNWTVLDEKGSNNGTSANMTEDDIVDGVGSYANGLSSGMGGDEVIGDAPYSTANALSVNMDVEDRVSDTPS